MLLRMNYEKNHASCSREDVSDHPINQRDEPSFCLWMAFIGELSDSDKTRAGRPETVGGLHMISIAPR